MGIAWGSDPFAKGSDPHAIPTPVSYTHLDVYKRQLQSEDYDSLGGFIIEHLDRLPEVGDEVTTDSGIMLVVETLDKNRVESVHVYLPEKKVSDKEDGDSEDPDDVPPKKEYGERHKEYGGS